MPAWGDLVGYYREPKECLELIRAMGMPCVKGNHDELCSTETDLEGFNPHAVEMAGWTRKQLPLADRQWLGNLKYVRQVEGFTIVHATLDGPERWGYVFDKLGAASSFREKHLRSGPYSKFEVEPGRKYFVNPGSVGQPRDRNPRPSCAIYDLEEQTIEHRRPDYNMSGGRDSTAT